MAKIRKYLIVGTQSYKEILLPISFSKLLTLKFSWMKIWLAWMISSLKSFEFLLWSPIETYTDCALLSWIEHTISDFINQISDIAKLSQAPAPAKLAGFS